MNKLYKMIAALEKIKQFADQCPQGQRGRPLSGASAQRLGDENICEKKRRDGETIYYKTSGQIEKDKKEKEERREERKKIGAKAKGRLSKISLSLREELRNKLKTAIETLSAPAPKPEPKPKTETKPAPKLERKKENAQPKPKAEKKEKAIPEQKTELKPTLKIEPKVESNVEINPSSPKSKAKLKDAKKVIKSIIGSDSFSRTKTAATVMSMTSGLSVEDSLKIIENEFESGSVRFTPEDAGGNWVEAVTKAVSKIPPERNSFLNKEFEDAYHAVKQYTSGRTGGWYNLTKIDLFYDYVKDRVPDITDSEFVTKVYDLFLNDKISLAPVADKMEAWDNKFVLPMMYGGELGYIR